MFARIKPTKRTVELILSFSPHHLDSWKHCQFSVAPDILFRRYNFVNVSQPWPAQSNHIEPLLLKVNLKFGHKSLPCSFQDYGRARSAYILLSELYNFEMHKLSANIVALPWYKQILTIYLCVQEEKMVLSGYIILTMITTPQDSSEEPLLQIIGTESLVWRWRHKYDLCMCLRLTSAALSSNRSSKSYMFVCLHAFHNSCRCLCVTESNIRQESEKCHSPWCSGHVW